MARGARGARRGRKYPKVWIEDVEHGLDNKCIRVRFAIRRNGVVFHIDIYPDRFLFSPQVMAAWFVFIEYLKQKAHLDIIVTEDDILEWVLKPFAEILREHAPKPAEVPVLTLEEWFSPKHLMFLLHVENEKLSAKPSEETVSKHWPNFLTFDDEPSEEDLTTWTTVYRPADIVVSPENPSDALFVQPGRVTITAVGKECFFKRIWGTEEGRNELRAYRVIEDAMLYEKYNLCRLQGVVVTADSKQVMGLLLSYIEKPKRLSAVLPDHFATSSGGPGGAHRGHPRSRRYHHHQQYDHHHPLHPDYDRQLAASAMMAADPAIRRQWMGQIEDAVGRLHQEGLVWGYPTADNVLIDANDEAWIVGFADSWTHESKGWSSPKGVREDLDSLSWFRRALLPAPQAPPARDTLS